MNWIEYGADLLKDISSRKQRMVAIALDKKDNIVSIGFNNYTKTHPLQARVAKLLGFDQRIYLHAEVAALIRAASFKKKVYKLVVVRLGRCGKIMNAKPCPICEHLIKLHGVSVIEHSI